MDANVTESWAGEDTPLTALSPPPEERVEIEHAINVAEDDTGGVDADVPVAGLIGFELLLLKCNKVWCRFLHFTHTPEDRQAVKECVTLRQLMHPSFVFTNS